MRASPCAFALRPVGDVGGVVSDGPGGGGGGTTGGAVGSGAAECHAVLPSLQPASARVSREAISRAFRERIASSIRLLEFVGTFVDHTVVRAVLAVGRVQVLAGGNEAERADRSRGRAGVAGGRRRRQAIVEAADIHQSDCTLVGLDQVGRTRWRAAGSGKDVVL